MSDKLPIDEQWDSLVDDWQSQSYKHIKHVDIDSLITQSKKRTLIAKAFIALNIMATIGLYISFFIGLYEGDWETPLMAYLGGGAVLSTVYVYYEIKIRVNTWKLSEGSPEQAVQRALSGIEGAIKYCWLMKISFWVLLPLMNWFTYEVGKMSDKPRLLAYAFGNGLLITSYLITHFYHKKRLKEKEQLVTSIKEGGTLN